MEPKGTLACARTYFLENGFVPISLGDTGKQSSTAGHSQDLRYIAVQLFVQKFNGKLEPLTITGEWK